MRNKMSIWVWHCDAQPDSYLFKGNPNIGIPPYHLGGVEHLLCGEQLVWEYTKHTLEMDVDIIWWNKRFPKQRVKPKSIMVEIRPFYKRKPKEKNE